MLDFDYRHLLGSSIRLTQANASTTEDVIAAVLLASKRKANRRMLPLSLLKPSDDLSSIAATINELRGALPVATAAIHELLTAPQVMYPIEDAVSGDGRKIQRAVMGGVFDGAEVPSGRAAILLQLEVTNKHQGREREVVSYHWYWEVGGASAKNASALRVELEKIYLRRKTGLVVLRNNEPHRPRHAILVLTTEQMAIASNESSRWMEAVKAVGYVQGIELEARGPMATTDRIFIQHTVNSGRDLLLLWGRAFDPRLAAIATEWTARRSRDTVISRTDDTLAAFIDALREELEWRNDLWEAVDIGRGATNPGSLQELVDRLPELTSEWLLVTDNARSQCVSSGYPDPGRMWDQLRGLALAAGRWRSAGGDVGGRLDGWVHDNFEIEIALHDDHLRASKFFSFESIEYSREPHVKVDDAKPLNECGRIYFAIDGVRQRFIVDHIGLHL